MASRRRVLGMLVMAGVAFVGYAALSGRATEMPEVFAQAPSLAQAEVLAEASGMPVLVFATAEWCGPCQALKRGALADAGVQRWVRENTHAVVADFTDRNNPPPEAERLRVTSIPTLVLLRDGKEVSRLGSPRSKEQLLAWLGEHSGPIVDWKHANPGQPVPPIDMAPRRGRPDEEPRATPGGS
ncbi:MAG: thioredoxin family protein [Planctomycetota bacterium]|nr:thioredoxin family protein [Planctomycetota bacterium]